MTAVSSVEGSEVSFADIVCADPEWVAAEFAELMVGIASVVTSTATSMAGLPRSNAAVAGPSSWPRSPAAGEWPPRVAERVRAPPA